MATIDVVSAIVTFMVVGGLCLRCGLMSNATLLAQALWSHRASARAATRHAGVLQQ